MLQEVLASLHSPLTPCHLKAPIGQRRDWEALDQDTRRTLISQGLKAQAEKWSQILASDYLEFSRTGNRERYEEKQFSRRRRLNALVLAECVQNQGGFLEDIINGIWMICEESAWQLPAHNSYIRDTPQLPLPDTSRPVIDLFAAETASVLALSAYLVGPSLASVSPLILSRIRQELDTRVLTPYLNQHFWWMGGDGSHLNNWTVWCTQNVLLTAALTPMEENRRRKIIEKACRSMDAFLDEYGEDGCCDEGAQYYRHAGLCLFGCLELLNAMTGDGFSSLYEAPKIRQIAAYILNVHVSGPWYINFSDCSPIAGRCGAREFLFGKRTQNQALMQLAAEDFRASRDPFLSQETCLYYRLLTVFSSQEMERCPSAALPLPQDRFYPSVGLFLARDPVFCLAVKAGDNDDSHNHNDTGSFTLYKDGLPLFADIGVETYQKKTFSPLRYEIWTMQSQYHNLPTFVGCSPEELEQTPFACAKNFGGSGQYGVMENNGPEYAAKNVSCSFDEKKAQISMELAGAYPDSRIRSFSRQVVFEKGRGITITDQTDCAPLRPVYSLITYETPVWDAQAGLLILGELGVCFIKNAADVSIQRLPILDKRLQTAWKHDLFRVLVTPSDSFLQLSVPYTSI